MTVKICVEVHTGYAGCVHKETFVVCKDWWDSLSPEETEEELDTYARGVRDNLIEMSAYVVEGN